MDNVLYIKFPRRKLHNDVLDTEPFVGLVDRLLNHELISGKSTLVERATLVLVEDEVERSFEDVTKVCVVNSAFSHWDLLRLSNEFGLGLIFQYREIVDQKELIMTFVDGAANYFTVADV